MDKRWLHLRAYLAGQTYAAEVGVSEIPAQTVKTSFVGVETSVRRMRLKRRRVRSICMEGSRSEAN